MPAPTPPVLCATFTALVMLTGCNDGSNADGGLTDGSMDATPDGAVEGAVIAPPEIPWLVDGVPPVMLTPCPVGWREVTGGQVTECDPYPEGGPATCEAGDAHFPGEAGCQPIGGACPAGDYAMTLPTDSPVIYVKADAAAGGDGSLSAPYAELGNIGWLTLAAGTTVALAKGSYAGTIALRAGVSVVGACTRDTILTGIDGPAAAVVRVVSAGDPGVLRNLSIVGASQEGVNVERGRAVTLDGVLLDRVMAQGVAATGRGTEMTISNTVIRGTVPEPASRAGGRAINVDSGARLDASRVLIMNNREFGIFATDDGTSISLTDTVIRDTQPHAGRGTEGNGVVIVRGAHLDGSRLLLAGNHETGLFVGEPGSAATLVDAVIRDTLPRVLGGYFGRGVNVEDGARFEGSRILVTNNHGNGIFTGRTGANATLSDIVVRDTQPNGLGYGRGIGVWGTGRLEGTRLLIAGNHQVGVLIANEGTMVTLVDTVIRDTQPQAGEAIDGRGISVQGGGRLVGTRLAIVHNHEIGIFEGGAGTAIEFEDVVIDDTLPRVIDGLGGSAIYTQDQATLNATRLRIDGAESTGIMASLGAVVTLADLSITHVTQAACAESTCPLFGMGFGLGAAGATVTTTRFEVRDVETCGVFVAPAPDSEVPPSVDLSGGRVTESAIGVCLQQEGYDLGRLTTNVLYQDNVANLDATSLPIPGAVDDTQF